VIETHSASVRKACKLLGTFPSVFKYNHKKKGDELVQSQLENLASCNTSWGFWKMYNRIRNLGLVVNHKKVYRIYTQMKLNMRRKYKKRLPARIKQGLAQPLHHNYTWSMDFMHDGLDNGKSFRSFNVIDDFNREILNITIDTSLTSERIVRELEKLVDWRGYPEIIRVDNGPEFIAQALEKWCSGKVILQFIQKGKPQQNGYVERFNRTFREDVLDKFTFESLKEVRIYTQAWMWMYNNERPHVEDPALSGDSLMNLTPTAFLLKYGKLHHPHKAQAEFPTTCPDLSGFQQGNYDWNTLVLFDTK